MNATPPEASPEYSRAQPRFQVPAASTLGGSAMVLAGGALGALLLIVAELTSLYAVSTPARGASIPSVSTGSHNAYALIPIALLAAALAYGAGRHGSRACALAIGALGILTLTIALIGDRPDSHATGLINTRAGRYELASASPQAGLYLETLGAVVLILTAGGGIFLGATAQRQPRRPQPRSRAAS